MEAADQVVAHVEGRESAAERGIDGIDGLRQAGGLVDGFGVGVAGQQFKTVRAVIEGRFERVVAGVGDGALQLDAAEGGAKLRAGGLLVEWTASGAEAQAESRIGGVGFFEHQQVMR